MDYYIVLSHTSNSLPDFNWHLGINLFRHAGRSTINVSDVLLLARRNEGLESILRAFVDAQREKAENAD